MQKKSRQKRPQPRPDQGNHLDAEFGGFFGKSGSGKSYQLWQKHLEWQSRRRLQVLCWSPKEEIDDYAGKLNCSRYTDMAQLVRAARAGKDVVFVPTLQRDQDEKLFDLFCRLAWALAPCELIAEEMHTVTRSNGGSPGWKRIPTMGRGYGIRVLGGSQRPANVDKDFFGGLSFIWAGAQIYEDDARSTARAALVTPAEILALQPRQGFSRSM